MNSVTEAELTPHVDGRIVTYAKDQKDYTPLPTVRFSDGLVYSEWTPTTEEISHLMIQLATGKPVKVRLWQWTFNHPLQPVQMEVVP